MYKDIIIVAIKTFFMNISIIYSLIKIKGHDDILGRYSKQIFFMNMYVSFLYGIFTYHTSLILNLFIYFLVNFFIVLFIHEYDDLILFRLLMSVCLSLLFMSAASIIPFIVKRYVLFDTVSNSILEYFSIGIIQLVLVYLFFKIKRYKNGFSFINERVSIKNVIMLKVLLILLLVSSIIFVFDRHRSIVDNFLFPIIIIFIVLILYLIKHSITKHYKLKMKDRTMEIFNEKLSEKDNEISALKAELENVLKINHKYNHRISAMEKAVASLSFNTEFAKENEEVIELVNSLSKEYKEELNEISSKNAIQKTGIFGIDNILEYMNNECTKNNIEFKVNLNTNLKELVENHINQNDLETMLGDHITDSIIAINSSDSINRKILLEFNKKDEVYEILFYDTGIEFEIDTLLKLGLEKITTHKETRRKRNRIYDNI